MCIVIVKETIEQMNKVVDFINLPYNSACIPGKVANQIFGKKNPEIGKAT